LALGRAVEKSRNILQTLKSNYDELSATGVYLVFDSRLGQASIDSRPFDLLTEFPSMVIQNEAVERLLEIEQAQQVATERLTETRAEIVDLKRQAFSVAYKNQQIQDSQITEKENRNEIAVLAVAMTEQEQQLVYRADTLISLRFDKLNFSLIGQIQTDRLIDQERSRPGTIQVVLGTVGELADRIIG
jgi:hypothetical protein